MIKTRVCEDNDLFPQSNGASLTPDHQAHGAKHATEDEVGNPLQTGEGVDVEQANKKYEQRNEDEQRHQEENKAVRHRSPREDQRTQHPIVKLVE